MILDERVRVAVDHRSWRGGSGIFPTPCPGLAFSTVDDKAGYLQPKFRRYRVGDVKFAGNWHAFFKAIWHHSPINGSSVGGQVDSPSCRCQWSVPGDGPDS